jgi:hypothetical protein
LPCSWIASTWWVEFFLIFRVVCFWHLWPEQNFWINAGFCTLNWCKCMECGNFKANYAGLHACTLLGTRWKSHPKKSGYFRALPREILESCTSAQATRCAGQIKCKDFNSFETKNGLLNWTSLCFKLSLSIIDYIIY